MSDQTGAAESGPWSANHVHLALWVIAFTYLPYLLITKLAASLSAPRGAQVAPGALPVLGHAWTIYKNYGRFSDFWCDCTQAAGGKPWCLLLPFQVPFVGYTDPRDVEHVLKVNFENYGRGPFARAMGPLLGLGIFAVDGHSWRFQRKTAANIFNVASFKRYVSDVFSEKYSLLTAQLDDAMSHGVVVDLHDLFFRFTMDSFAKIGFGYDPGCLRTKEPVDFAKAFDRTQALCNRRFWNPLWPVTEWLDGSRWKITRDVALLRCWARKMIQKRQDEVEGTTTQSDRSHADLLSMFLVATGPDGQQLSQELIIDYIMNFIIAGRDTTAQALSWTFYLLSQHPTVVDRVLQEINEVRGLRQSSEEGDNLLKLSYEEVKALKYSRWVFLEALRLYPSVPGDAKWAIHEDVLPSGVHVPAGTMVAFMPYVMGRLPSLWGEDALKFRPERWEERGSMPSAYEYPVFNAGPRICLGKNLAELEGVYVMAQLLSRYRMQPVPGQVIRYATSVTLPMQNGFKVEIKARRRTEP